MARHTRRDSVRVGPGAMMREPRRYEYPLIGLTPLMALLRGHRCEECALDVPRGYDHACGVGTVPIDVVFRCEECAETFTLDAFLDEPAATCDCIYEAHFEPHAPRWRVYWPEKTLDTDRVRLLAVEVGGISPELAANVKEQET